jgi:Putative glycosyl/glycerophosphate transferases involved in teichoic acid biosynthesis TagF/TagB/EpsJ/RodC
MEKVKKVIRNTLKHNEPLRLFVRKVHVALKQSRYRRIAEKVDIDEKMVLFETFMGRQYGDNPKAIYEYMISRPEFDDYRFVWVMNDAEKAAAIPQLKRAETVKLLSDAYYRACASAKYVITNSNLDYGIIRKDGQVFLQTWHGTPLKRLRCDIEAEKGNVLNSLREIRMKNDLDVVRYDYFISPSAFSTEKFTSAFNLKALGKEDIIIETGYPRNDFLFNYEEKDAEEIRTKLGVPASKKVMLYAPTFRDNQHDGSGYTYDTHLDFDRLREEFGDEYVILFRAHYFVANQFDFSRYEGFVYDVSALDDITPLYLISDLLITDYSSVFFDYANLKRPVLFYMYDLEQYANDIRGFYFSLDELPGPILKTEDELVDAIRRVEETEEEYRDKYRAFNEKFNYLDDGNAAGRVIDELKMENQK